jgi:hypothetical protein
LVGRHSGGGVVVSGKEDFVKSFHEEVEVLMVCKGSNKASRFLEAVVFAEGAEKGLFGSLGAVEDGVGINS